MGRKKGSAAEGPEAGKKIEVFQDNQAKLLGFYKQCAANPALMMDNGFLRVVSEASTLSGGEQRMVQEQDGESLLVPLTLTNSQRFLNQSIERYRVKGQRFNAIIGKDRRRRSTTFFLIYLYVSAITSGYQNNILVAQNEKMAQKLFKSVRIAHDNNIFSVNVFRRTNQVDMYGFDGQVGETLIKESYVSSIPCSLKSLDGVRGDFITKILKTECPSYEPDNAHQLFNESASPTIARGPNALNVEESTFFGRNNYFAEQFERDWKAQGCCNWNEPGYKAGAASKEAIFFPFYTNEMNRMPFNEGLDPADLIADFDDEEKIIYDLCLKFYFQRLAENGSPVDKAHARARHISAETLLFRRCYLKNEYMKFVIPGNPFEALPNKDSFYRQYPINPFQAMDASGEGLAFGQKLVKWISSTANEKEPVFVGDIDNRDGLGYVLTPNPSGCLRIWKWPHTCKGIVDLCIDPHVGSRDVRRGEEFSDKTWCSSWEWNTGEQVLEWWSHDSGDAQHSRIWAITKLIASLQKPASGEVYKGAIAERRFPYVAQENLPQPLIMRYLLEEKDYPYDKLYREDVLGGDKKDRVRRGDILGWTPQGRKVGAVMHAITYTRNGMKELNDVHLDDEEVLRKRFVRSRGLADQIGWFVETKSGGDSVAKYHAERKGRGGERSCDDAVTTLYISCYIQEKMIQEYGGRLLMVDNDPEEPEVIRVEKKLIQSINEAMMADVDSINKGTWGRETSAPVQIIGSSRIWKNRKDMRGRII